MISVTEYYRKRLLERDQRVNIIINSININNKKRKYEEAFLQETPNYKKCYKHAKNEVKKYLFLS